MSGTRSACCDSSTDTVAAAAFREAVGPVGRHGFTLIELMWAMTLSLVVMGAVASLFGVFTRSLTAAQASADMSARLRTAAWRLRQDLSGVTVDLMPPVRPESESGYFEYFEGPSRDAHAKQSFGGWALAGDVDDVLMFTTRSEGQPFVGRFGDGTIESPVADVAWFCMPSPVQPLADTTLFTLYRRQKIVMPYVGRDSFVGTNSVASIDMNSIDLSVRMEGDRYMPNSLGDLTKRENRILRGERMFPPLPAPYLLPRPAIMNESDLDGNSNCSASEKADKAFDGSADTAYLNEGGTNSGIIFEYAVPCRIASFIITTSHYGNSMWDPAGYDPTEYRLEGSNDGSSWQNLSSGNLSLPAARKVDSAPVTLPDLPFFSRYRITFTRVKLGPYMAINELKLFGNEQPSQRAFSFPYVWANDMKMPAGKLLPPPDKATEPGQPLTRTMPLVGQIAMLSGNRVGEDVVLSNILSFDVRVFDPQARRGTGPALKVVGSNGSSTVTCVLGNAGMLDGWPAPLDLNIFPSSGDWTGRPNPKPTGVLRTGSSYMLISDSGAKLSEGTITGFRGERDQIFTLSAPATVSGTMWLTTGTLEPGDAYWGGPGFFAAPGPAVGGYVDLAWGGEVKMPLNACYGGPDRNGGDGNGEEDIFVWWHDDKTLQQRVNALLMPDFYPPAAQAVGTPFPPPGRTAFQTGGVRVSGTAVTGLESGSFRTYDTWSTHYESNGIDDDGDGIVDEGTNGVDDNNDGVPDDPAEAETSAPYPARLQGLEVRIRCYEPASGQIRQITLRHTFLAK